MIWVRSHSLEVLGLHQRLANICCKRADGKYFWLYETHNLLLQLTNMAIDKKTAQVIR